ncbi:hypothetical protein D3C81_1117140 [compost metagenome]
MLKQRPLRCPGGQFQQAATGDRAGRSQADQYGMQLGGMGQVGPVHTGQCLLTQGIAQRGKHSVVAIVSSRKRIYQHMAVQVRPMMAFDEPGQVIGAHQTLASHFLLASGVSVSGWLFPAPDAAALVCPSRSSFSPLMVMPCPSSTMLPPAVLNSMRSLARS